MKHLFLFSILSISCLTISAQNWVQVGDAIDGSAQSDYFGTNASLSSDGSTLAIGAPYNDDNGNKAGQIRIFSYDGTAWSQKGNSINGDGGMDYASLVALSANGSAVAVGSTGNYVLKVKVFDFDGSEWVLRGTPLDGIEGDLAGGALSMSADGNRAIIGAPGYSNSTGGIFTYEWNGTEWNSLGSEIVGNAAGDRFGRSVKISGDGTTLITGTEYFPTLSAFEGQVRVYEYDGSEWIQKGNDIVGTQQYAALGSSVDISDDGNTIIVGEPGSNAAGTASGKTSVFNWNGSAWILKGTPIVGISNQDKTGSVVAINGSATTIATKGLGVGGSELGNVRIFRFDGTDWNQMGETFAGQHGDVLGYGLDFSASGDTISIGNTGIDFNRGQMKVYYYNGSTGMSENSVESAFIYPNPSNGHFKIDLGKEYTEVSVQISNILGQTVSTVKVAFAKSIEQSIDGPAGIYFVNIATANGGSRTLKVIKN